jgi:tRNA1(Val) A37 N6-methylase TrmN6
VSLAEQNAAANEWSGLRFVAADIALLPDLGMFDHAIANPPYHLADGTASPDAFRQSAKHASAHLLAVWTAALARKLRPRGTLTFIIPAIHLPAVTEAFAAGGCQPGWVLPLWPKAGRPAKLVLLQGVKAGKRPFRVLPGLVLHEANGSFTPEADAILRGGAAVTI